MGIRSVKRKVMAKKSARALRAGVLYNPEEAREIVPSCEPAPCESWPDRKNRAEPPAGAQGKGTSDPVAVRKNAARAPRGARIKAPLKTLMALVVLHKAEKPLSPRAFAKLMWPDSPGWRRSARCGPNGVSRGGGMNLAAGGLLGKLAKQGLATLNFASSPPGWVLSEKGKHAVDALKEFAQVMK